MDFKEATNILWGTEPVTAAEMAERLGKDPHTIRRARINGAERAFGAKGVEAVMADLADKHADEFERRVRELRARSTNLRIG